MKILTIKKTDWEKGVDAARQSYRLFGPVLEDNMHVIRELDENQYPDLGYIDTVLSFKSILFPQSENILTASLNENDDNHHIFARPPADYSPRAVIGIRPYDAKAVELVKMNFDTEDYR
ncbi:MAG: 4Fe-4S ferredoxin, partial [Desulfobacteraceae bacterium]